MSFDFSQSSYESLRSIISERTERIIPWVGAGLSAFAGFPDWRMLRSILEDALFNKAKTLERNESTKLSNMGKIIQGLNDLWVVFEMLQENLGSTIFHAIIRENLGHAHLVQTPEIYKQIWRLKVQGVLNLNLDRLVSKACAETGTISNVSEFSGDNVNNYMHVLKSPRQFICNLHGITDDTSSWVLTKSALKKITMGEPYKLFINTCLTSSTVVFVGISVDDIAVGGFLQNLTNIGVDFNNHYWITSRQDKRTDDFAESIGIRIIRYNAPDGDQSELLELFDDLLSYVSPEDKDVEQPAFINPCESNLDSVPNNVEILSLDTEEIRDILNKKAMQILQNPTPDSYKVYEDFSIEYDEAIYRAWYTSVQPGSNKLCGYSLMKEVAFGAFGKVFHAYSPDGLEVAVKVLHEDIRRDQDLLHSFRRGVKSMSILSAAGVEGMVPYKDASEIPAFVVMDWIEGPSLHTAVEASYIDNWEMILNIAASTSTILRKGHLLPERVLHRDLRPSNIMLKNYYNDPDSWEVVVLDFDLSWYRGSFEKSIIHGSSLTGYLAPEQVQKQQGVSTRHTSVDSFGLGMTVFFMCGGRDPFPNEQFSSNWEETVYEAVERIKRYSWQSIRNRVARLVLNATHTNQQERWDMAQIEAELYRLLYAVKDPDSVDSAELVAEEIAARCSFMEGYIWDDDNIAATKEAPSGIKLSIYGDETERAVRISLIWGLPGIHGKGEGVGKWIPERVDSAKNILKKGGWQIDNYDNKWANARIECHMDITSAVSSINKIIEYVQQATDLIRFN